MFGQVDISALDRVLMDVLNFLFHHVFVLDDLRVTSLLPELEFLIDFVALFEVLELAEHGLVVHCFHRIDDGARGE